VLAPVAQQPQPPSYFAAVRRQTTVTSMLNLLSAVKRVILPIERRGNSISTNQATKHTLRLVRLI
jgi:hypothetical protein